MAKFQSLKYKRDLKKAQHFVFIQAFISHWNGTVKLYQDMLVGQA